ncbi:SusD/RagB family nutrient-binding outer membrane lipoprotein [Flagellimonas baculiformis]|uniref:SusD/RagB family nutrient-binding outer membrane lipoprotein n=1 Tax=Flagellimonas baculiformis TaxID=3067310 RepID=UPI00296ECAED|nr:SusD/RagB family nutrient-binding outer membrane lipoprotein [Muricauda sp. D6]
MKRSIYITTFALLALVGVSCDDGFEDINTDPTKATEIAIEYKFPKAILYTAGQRYESWRGNFIYCSTMIQHLANTQGYWSGDKYFYNAAYSSAYWDANYPQGIKSIEDMKAELESNGQTDSPEYAMVRILRVFAYHRMTDLYGDIPYSEAGKAYTEGNTRPAYDSQESIYADMLKELEEAAAVLGTGTAEIGAADILYAGNQTQWKKWAYSLMLRLGLRMVKVDEAAAEEWVAKAIAGGVMESNDDIAYIRHQSDGNGIVRNGNGEVFTADRSARISTTFLEILEGDPRMRVYAALPPDEDGFVNENPADQKGLPNGLDGATIQDYEGGSDLSTYSEPNSNYLMGEDAPMFWQTYAEVEFMLAEAAVRWGLAGGDPEVHYNAGVTAAMQYLSLYGGGATITNTEINDYLAANPFDAGNALEQINTQYWVAVFLNEYEAYANWRRTGFPTLTPVSYDGNQSNGTIPRRLIYPTNEAVLNSSNYNAVLTAQGPDSFTTRMWWDVE